MAKPIAPSHALGLCKLWDTVGLIISSTDLISESAALVFAYRPMQLKTRKNFNLLSSNVHLRLRYATIGTPLDI